VTIRVPRSQLIETMSHRRNLPSILFAAAFLLTGCAGQPSSNSDATGARKANEGKSDARPTSGSAPARETAAQPRAQQSEPEANSEGITIFELQERLAGLGYKLGEVDGVNGPRTVEALKKFQGDNKLPVTGAIDAETVRRLRNAKPQP
jgi:peptidoglycan hydrolase-like protein with peptidoglycan-binding domain